MGWSDDVYMRRSSSDDASPTKQEASLAGAPRRHSSSAPSGALTSAKAARSASTPPPSPLSSRPPLAKRSASNPLDGSGLTNGAHRVTDDSDCGDGLAPLLLVGAAVAGKAFQHMSPRRQSAGSPTKLPQSPQQPATPPPPHMRHLEHLPYTPRNLPPPILMSPRTPRDRPKTPRSVRFSEGPDIEVRQPFATLLAGAAPGVLLACR